MPVGRPSRTTTPPGAPGPRRRRSFPDCAHSQRPQSACARARFHAVAGTRPRADASRGRPFHRAELAGDVDGARDRPGSGAFARSHAAATTASWCSPSTSWTLGDRPWRSCAPASRTRVPPPRPRSARASRGSGPRAVRRRVRDRAGRRPRCGGASTARARGCAESRRGPYRRASRRAAGARRRRAGRAAGGSGRFAARRAGRRARPRGRARAVWSRGAAERWSSSVELGDPRLRAGRATRRRRAPRRARRRASPSSSRSGSRPLGLEQRAERTQV